MIGLLEQAGPRDVLAAVALLAAGMALVLIWWCWPEVPSLRVVSGRVRRMRLSIGARRVPRAEYDPSIPWVQANFPNCDPHPYDWKKREPMIWRTGD